MCLHPLTGDRPFKSQCHAALVVDTCVLAREPVVVWVLSHPPGVKERWINAEVLLWLIPSLFLKIHYPWPLVEAKPEICLSHFQLFFSTIAMTFARMHYGVLPCTHNNPFIHWYISLKNLFPFRQKCGLVDSIFDLSCLGIPLGNEGFVLRLVTTVPHLRGENVGSNPVGEVFDQSLLICIPNCLLPQSLRRCRGWTPSEILQNDPIWGNL